MLLEPPHALQEGVARVVAHARGQRHAALRRDGGRRPQRPLLVVGVRHPRWLVGIEVLRVARVDARAVEGGLERLHALPLRRADRAVRLQFDDAHRRRREQRAERHERRAHARGAQRHARLTKEGRRGAEQLLGVLRGHALHRAAREQLPRTVNLLAHQRVAGGGARVEREHGGGQRGELWVRLVAAAVARRAEHGGAPLLPHALGEHVHVLRAVGGKVAEGVPLGAGGAVVQAVRVLAGQHLVVLWREHHVEALELGGRALEVGTLDEEAARRLVREVGVRPLEPPRRLAREVDVGPVGLTVVGRGEPTVARAALELAQALGVESRLGAKVARELVEAAEDLQHRVVEGVPLLVLEVDQPVVALERVYVGRALQPQQALENLEVVVAGAVVREHGDLLLLDVLELVGHEPLVLLLLAGEPLAERHHAVAGATHVQVLIDVRLALARAARARHDARPEQRRVDKLLLVLRPEVEALALAPRAEVGVRARLCARVAVAPLGEQPAARVPPCAALGDGSQAVVERVEEGHKRGEDVVVEQRHAVRILAVDGAEGAACGVRARPPCILGEVGGGGPALLLPFGALLLRRAVQVVDERRREPPADHRGELVAGGVAVGAHRVDEPLAHAVVLVGGEHHLEDVAVLQRRDGRERVRVGRRVGCARKRGLDRRRRVVALARTPRLGVAHLETVSRGVERDDGVRLARCVGAKGGGRSAGARVGDRVDEPTAPPIGPHDLEHVAQRERLNRVHRAVVGSRVGRALEHGGGLRVARVARRDCEALVAHGERAARARKPELGNGERRARLVDAKGHTARRLARFGHRLDVGGDGEGDEPWQLLRDGALVTLGLGHARHALGLLDVPFERRETCLKAVGVRKVLAALRALEAALASLVLVHLGGAQVAEGFAVLALGAVPVAARVLGVAGEVALHVRHGVVHAGGVTLEVHSGRLLSINWRHAQLIELWAPHGDGEAARRLECLELRLIVRQTAHDGEQRVGLACVRCRVGLVAAEHERHGAREAGRVERALLRATRLLHATHGGVPLCPRTIGTLPRTALPLGIVLLYTLGVATHASLLQATLFARRAQIPEHDAAGAAPHSHVHGDGIPLVGAVIVLELV